MPRLMLYIRRMKAYSTVAIGESVSLTYFVAASVLASLNVPD
jgi:hypothetical protein